MKSSLPQGVLKYLAAVAVAFTTGLVDPAPSLLELPAELLGEVVEEVEDDEWQPASRKLLLTLLAHDPRPFVRGHVAERADILWDDDPVETEILLGVLARDSSPQVRTAAGRGLERILERGSPLDRVMLVAKWTTSDAPSERAAIAAALRGPTPVLIEDLAIDQLARDPTHAVRRLAVEAAARHHPENPDAYARVIARLASDPVRSVRKRARHVLEELEQA